MGERNTQWFVDEFYLKNGPCCAGCDWWRFFNSSVGECTRRAPVGSKSRLDQLDMVGLSLRASTGHVLTKREQYCGDFQDTFDWSKRHLKDERLPPKRPTGPKRKLFERSPFFGGDHD